MRKEKARPIKGRATTRGATLLTLPIDSSEEPEAEKAKTAVRANLPGGTQPASHSSRYGTLRGIRYPHPLTGVNRLRLLSRVISPCDSRAHSAPISEIGLPPTPTLWTPPWTPTPLVRRLSYYEVGRTLPYLSKDVKSVGDLKAKNGGSPLHRVQSSSPSNDAFGGGIERQGDCPVTNR
jgi:hypothetical protein